MLDPSHLNLVRDIILMFGCMLAVGFIWIFLSLYFAERRRLRRF